MSLSDTPSVSVDFAGLKQQYAALKPKIDTAMAHVLDHGQFIMGPEVGELEKALAEFCGIRHCIAVSSGTDALLAALMALDVGPGSAVFLPAFTFTATAEVIVLLGARPVFVDVDERTFNIDPANLEKQIDQIRSEDAFQPAVVMAVDLFGQPADYGQLRKICNAEGMALIGDAAQSLGGSFCGQAVGGLADLTATSFFPAKPLGCYGDGGAIFTDDTDLAEILKSIRAHGKGRDKYDIVRVGLNARMDTLQAAILLAKLETFPEEITVRRQVADAYDATLSDVVATPVLHPGADSAWAQYSILLDNRDDIAAALKEGGVPTAIYYPRPLHFQTAYQKFGDGEGSLPISERLSGRILSLPINAYLSTDAQKYVTDRLREVMSISNNF
jgi:UDP-2-acetamido-2-deoxy-ribo-hexuluronate aminotransferase